jgi:hypothetical protein
MIPVHQFKPATEFGTPPSFSHMTPSLSRAQSQTSFAPLRLGRWPPPNYRQAGLRINDFEACSRFTHLAACVFVRFLKDSLRGRLQPLRYLRDCSSYYRLERKVTGRGWHSLKNCALARRATNFKYRRLIGPVISRVQKPAPLRSFQRWAIDRFSPSVPVNRRQHRPHRQARRLRVRAADRAWVPHGAHARCPAAHRPKPSRRK